MLLDEHWATRGSDAPWLVMPATEARVVALLLPMLREAGLSVAHLAASGGVVSHRVLPDSAPAPDVWLVTADPAALGSTVDLQPHASVVLEAELPTAEVADGPSAYQRVRHACIYPSFNDEVRTLVEEAEVIDGARAIGLTLGAPGPSDVGLVENVVVDRAFHARRAVEAIELFALADLQARAGQAPLTTRDVLEAMAAAALARSVGVAPEAILAGLTAG